MKRLATLVALLISFSVQPAQASEQPSAQTKTPNNAVGLVVKYRTGVSSFAPNGQVTGQNFAGVALAAPHGIGNGLTAVSFKGHMSQAAAQAVADNLKLDPRVVSVLIDHEFGLASVVRHASPTAQMAQLLAVAIKPASAPATIAATDAWTQAAPTTAQLKVSWTAPKSMYGAKLTGYQLWVSVGAAAFALNRVTAASVRSATIATGLAAGTRVRFYVKAVTKVGSVSKIGLASKTASATPTTTPSVPTLIGYSDGAASSPSWQPLTGASTGGLPVTYIASATAANQSTVTCQTVGFTCNLADLASGVNYTISVTATNSRGSSVSAPAVRPSDTLFYSQWYLYSKFGISAPQAWAQLASASVNHVVVAVIDTGITSHSDLNSQVIPGYDFVSLDMGSNDGTGWDSDASDPGDYSQSQSSSWHGTHVAGLIAAAANGQGIVGVDPYAKIQPVRALGALGGKESDLYAAVTWASGGSVAGVPGNPTPAKVINISMGTTTPTGCDDLVESAFQGAISRGVTIVTAAGNGDANGNPMQALYSYPGDCLGSINVGATGFSGNASYYSNYGLGVDISAPGGDDHVTAGTPPGTGGMIVSTLNTGTTVPAAETYAEDEGTSMAAPLVSGAVALMMEKNSNLTPSQVWGILKISVKPFAAGTDCALSAGTDQQLCGAGILDVAKALSLVQ